MTAPEQSSPPVVEVKNVRETIAFDVCGAPTTRCRNTDVSPYRVVVTVGRDSTTATVSGRIPRSGAVRSATFDLWKRTDVAHDGYRVPPLWVVSAATDAGYDGPLNYRRISRTQPDSVAP